MIKRFSKDVPISHHNSTAHITWSVDTNSNKPITLRGYAVDSESRVKIESCKMHKQVANTISEIEIRQNILVSRIKNDLEKIKNRDTNSNKISSESESISDLVKAFKELINLDDPIKYTWAHSTRKKYTAFFENKILPFLINLDHEFTDDDLADLKESLVEKALKDKRSIGRVDVTTEGVKTRLMAAQCIYDRMRIIDPSLPTINLDIGFTGKVIHPEQQKSIPAHIRKEIIKRLVKLIPINPQLAAAAILMFGLGLRTAEAAAVNLGELIKFQGTKILFVKYQIIENERTEILKSVNAYRKIPLVHWVSEMLDLCSSYLTEEMKENEYLCNPHDLSAQIKKIIMNSGVTEEYINITKEDMLRHPDLDTKRKPIHDVHAYIFRRDWASRAKNICGLSSLEIDYLMGHENKMPQKDYADFRQNEFLIDVVKKLERYIFNPKISKHPGCSPYSLKHAQDISIIPYDVIRIRNNDICPIRVDLDIEAALNAESITVISPINSYITGKVRHIPTNGLQSSLPMIGSSSLIMEDKFYEEE